MWWCRWPVFPWLNAWAGSWIWTQVETFMMLKPGSSIEQVRARLTNIPKTYAAPSIKSAMNQTLWRIHQKWPGVEFICATADRNSFYQSIRVYNRLNDVGNIKLYMPSSRGYCHGVVIVYQFHDLSTSQYVRKAEGKLHSGNFLALDAISSAQSLSWRHSFSVASVWWSA